MKYFKAVPLRVIRPGNRREDPLTVNYGPRIMCNTYSRGEKKKKKNGGSVKICQRNDVTTDFPPRVLLLINEGH